LTPVVLASTSVVRASLLAAAGVSFTAVGSGVDEDAIKGALLAEGASARDIAAELADRKALQVSAGHAGWIIGADQTLEFDGGLFDKVADIEAARARLALLRGCRHQLHAAVAVARDGEVVWRHAATASLTVRAFSDAFLDDYLSRNGEAALSSVGCYHLEGEGVQLFERVEGDYFAILGLPLVELLAALRGFGAIAA
jgi:septum formation protein